MTLIEWCEKTWNPIRARRRSDGKLGWFCTHVSEACRNCYAEHQNVMGGTNPGRFGNGVRYAVDQQKLVDIFVDWKTLRAPLHWKRGVKIFPCSMTDLYAEWVPDTWLYQIYAVMALTPQHFYIVLTKRSERRKIFLTLGRGTLDGIVGSMEGLNGGELLPKFTWPLPNVIEMASFGTQAEANKEIPFLLDTPAAVRGVSAEPLLERVDLRDVVIGDGDSLGDGLFNYGSDSGLDWVIAGGESGSRARAFALEWGDDLRRQCESAGCAFFMKQIGSRPIWRGMPFAGDIRVGKKVQAHAPDRKGGNIESWPDSLRVREYPEVMRSAKEFDRLLRD